MLRPTQASPRAAVYYIRPGSRGWPTREQVVAWSLVGLLHAWLLHALMTHSRWNAEPDGDNAIEVSFVTDALPPVWSEPEWPRLPARAAATPSQASRGAGVKAEQYVQQETVPDEPPPARLLGADGRPLSPKIAEFEAWDDADWALRDRIARLPGASDARAAEVVALRMRVAMTPQRVVLSVLQFLFGRPTLDDCRTIESRLLVSDPGVSREIDLHKFRSTCGG